MEITYLKENIFNDLSEDDIKKSDNILPYDKEELWLYTRIDSKRSGLPVDICIDTAQAYEIYDHELWIYFNNSYTEWNQWVPIVVSNNPQLAFPNYFDIKISKEDLNEIFYFVRYFKKTLKLLADEKISRFGFGKKIHNALYESLENALFEMSIYHENATGVPMSIYVDDTASTDKAQHEYRLKFAYPPEEKKSRNFIPLSIPDMKIENEKADKNITGKDRKKLFTYAEANKNIIMGAADHMIDDEEYYEHMFKIDKKGIPIPITPSLYSYSKITKENKNGYTKVLNNQNKINYINSNGKLISQMWYDKGSLFRKTLSHGLRAEVERNSIKVFLAPDGTYIRYNPNKPKTQPIFIE